MSKPIATCNCKRHRKVCLKGRTAKSVGNCTCKAEHFVEVKLEYSVQAEDFVCATCRHYPVWVKPEPVLTDEDKGSFSQDLRAILATWNLEPDDEDSPGEKWLLNLVNQERSA